MTYEAAEAKILQENHVLRSTMMSTPCLRYKAEFIAMMFDREDALIIKVSPERVTALIADGIGREFNFTKKRFKEWVLIPQEYDSDYETYMREALIYAQRKD